MRWASNFNIFANTVMMSRSGKPSHSAMLLEGWDDERLYKNFTHADCLTFPVDGRRNVLGIVKVLSERKQRGVIGIVDADVDHLEKQPLPQNVFRTDCRDIECHLIDSLALDRVLTEHLSKERAVFVRKFLFTACRDLGILWWAVQQINYIFGFKKLKYMQLINIRNVAFSHSRLCKEIIVVK